MIEALKDDKIFHKLGGKFKFVALVQRRMRELMDGARPLVERRGRTDFEVAVQEVVEGKIGMQMDGHAADDETDSPAETDNHVQI